MFRSLYFTGQMNEIPCRHNKCYTSVDKIASYLFSPAEARFSITFEADETSEWADIADAASRHVNREVMRHSVDLAMAAAVDLALIEGSCFIKMCWSHNGYEPHIIRQHQMGVLREDMEELDKQEAFTHSYWLTEGQFARLIYANPDRKEIMARANASYVQLKDDDQFDNSFFQQIVVGGLSPISTTTPSGQTGTIQNVFSRQPSLKLDPEIAKTLIQVHDLWVYDDEFEDWITIRYIEGMIVEGKDRLQNLGDIYKAQPFIKVCPNEVVGYFWGRSELANLANLQGMLNARIDNADRIIKLKARPPRAFRGFSGMTPEKALALYSPGGQLTDDAPAATTSIDTLAPDFPPELMPYIEKIEAWYDEIAGLTAVLSGQGDAGIRGNMQANTMIRTSSPRLRDRSLLVERQYAELGQKCLQLSQTKDARVYRTSKAKANPVLGMLGMGGKKPAPEAFLLSQLPEDAMCVVDSHTSSPAFSGDQINLAFALAKIGAIDGEDVIDMTNVSNKDRLIQRFRLRQEAQAKLIQEHPELLAKGHGKH